MQKGRDWIATFFIGTRTSVAGARLCVGQANFFCFDTSSDAAT